MARSTEVFRVMPWVGGINTSVDPGVLNFQELVEGDNVVFSSTGARIKREALEYLDNDIGTPDRRSSSGTTRSLRWTATPLVTRNTPDERLVVGEKINVSGVANYVALDAPITSISHNAEVTEVNCVGDTAGSLAGKYFLISAGDQVEDYYVWYQVSGSGTDPEVAGRTGVMVAISTGDNATAVGAATATALHALDEFSASASLGTVTVTAATAGYTDDPNSGTSGFSISTPTQGGTTITYEAETSLSESLTSAGSIEVERASHVLWAHDYWRWIEDVGNTQLLVYATADFQLFTLDDSGRRVQIHGQEQQTLIVCAAASTLTTGDYWLLNGPSNETNYYVWYNKDGGGGDPLVSGRTAIPVAITGGMTAAQVASATQAAIDAEDDFTATVDDDEVTVTAARAGVTTESIDGNTGFTISTLAYGATLPAERLETVRMLVFNERLHIFFSGLGNYHVIYNPEEDDKYQLPTANSTANGLNMPDASFAFIHLGRIWTNHKPDRDSLHYCETFDHTLWFGLGDSGSLPINPGDGDPEGITNGYVYKGFAVAAKKDARYRIQGSSPEDFFVERISQGLGNEGALAIPVDETDVVFVSKRGVHSQQATDAYGDTDAMYLSADIKPTFNDFEAAQLKLIQGAYIPELNSIALSITEDGEQSQNDVWLYNFEVQVPDKGRPGAWYRWPGISCTALNRRFTNSKYKLIFGTQNGRIIQAQKENDYADFGATGIPFRIKTGVIYPGNDPQSMKAFKKITMIYRPRGNFSFSVQAKIDNQETQSFAFNEISGLDILGEDFVLGSSLLGSANALAPYTFVMDGIGRGVTLTITQPSQDEQIEIWGFAFETENLDLEQEVQ